jgi:hypothetical protein
LARIFTSGNPANISYDSCLRVRPYILKTYKSEHLDHSKQKVGHVLLTGVR